MSQCRVCTAEVTWATDPAGNKVPLDDHELSTQGEDRYRITGFTAKGETLAEPVSAAYQTQAHVDHRKVCQQPRR